MAVHKVEERLVGLEQGMLAAGRPECKELVVAVVAVVLVPVMVFHPNVGLLLAKR